MKNKLINHKTSSYQSRVYLHFLFISIPCFLLAFFISHKYSLSQDAYFLSLSIIATVESAFFMLSVTLGGIVIVLPNNPLIKYFKRKKLFHNFFQYLEILIIISLVIIILCLFNTFIEKQTYVFTMLMGLTFSHFFTIFILSILCMRLLSLSHR